MAERFARGGRLIAIGRRAAARSDARHVAVEFVHPVIVGKRALPALGLRASRGRWPPSSSSLAEPDDIVIAFGEPADGPELGAALALARERGCLTIAFAPLGAEWELEPPSADPFVRQELVETLYHVLWELVHVFFEHRGLLEGRTERRCTTSARRASSTRSWASRSTTSTRSSPTSRASVLMKADEVGALRAQTLGDGFETLCAAAADAARRLRRGRPAAGPRQRRLGDRRDGRRRRPRGPRRQRLARAARARPHRRHRRSSPRSPTTSAPRRSSRARSSPTGAAGDALLALSTSGDSLSVIAALEEARRRGLRTIALVGYDGGRVAAEALADHVVVTRSEHIPRIQEAQATAYHVLRELVES